LPVRPIQRGVTIALVAVAASATAAQAAVGGTYATQLTASVGELTSSLNDLGAVTGMSIQYPVKPSTARRAATRLAGADAKLRHVAKTLAAMHPPAAVRADHARLVKGVDALEHQVRPVLARLRAGYLVAAARLPNLPAVSTVGAALTALRKHGYHVG
jgi:hypothetical protein